MTSPKPESTVCGANAPHKIASIVAGMATRADSIDDLDVIRSGGMGRLFGEWRAPSPLHADRKIVSSNYDGRSRSWYTVWVAAKGGPSSPPRLELRSNRGKPVDEMSSRRRWPEPVGRGRRLDPDLIRFPGSRGTSSPSGFR